MISIALFEDNPVHQEKIRNMIDQALSAPHTLDIYGSAKEFSDSSKLYEIIFMDIELGDDSGITLAQELNRSMPDAQIIYVTQHLEHASSVYESRHIYFINKADMDVYLPKALDVALEKIKKQDILYLEFAWNKEPFQLRQGDILYFERILRTTEIHTFKKTFYTAEKIGDLEKRLSSTFVRSHQSYIINMNALTDIRKNCVILNGCIEVPISRAHYKEVKRRFNLFQSRP